MRVQALYVELEEQRRFALELVKYIPKLKPFLVDRGTSQVHFRYPDNLNAEVLKELKVLGWTRKSGITYKRKDGSWPLTLKPVPNNHMILYVPDDDGVSSTDYLEEHAHKWLPSGWKLGQRSNSAVYLKKFKSQDEAQTFVERYISKLERVRFKLSDTRTLSSGGSYGAKHTGKVFEFKRDDWRVEASYETQDRSVFARLRLSFTPKR